MFDALEHLPHLSNGLKAGLIGSLVSKIRQQFKFFLFNYIPLTIFLVGKGDKKRLIMGGKKLNVALKLGMAKFEFAQVCSNAWIGPYENYLEMLIFKPRLLRTPKLPQIAPTLLNVRYVID